MEQERDCVLVYLTELVETDDDFPTKFGGQPIWLTAPPTTAQLKCSYCKSGNALTFLCQVYAPLELSHAYHRVLYVFFCSNCALSKRGIRVFRMQLPQEKLELIPNKLECKTMPEEYSVSTETMSADEFNRLVEKAGHEAEEEAEPDDDYVEIDQSDEEEYEQPNVKGLSDDKEEDISSNVKKVLPPADPVFETYRKVLHQLSEPIAIYSAEPLMFKKGDFHIKQKRCASCKGSMQLELQINSTILTKFQSLLSGDWGAIYMLTCKNSCQSSESWTEQEVELQIEQDALAGRAELEKELERMRLEEKKKEAKREKRKQKRQRQKLAKANGEAEKSDDDQASEEEKEISKPVEEGDWD